MIRTGAINWQNPVSRCGLNDGLVSWWLARGPWIGGGTWFDLCKRNNGTLTNMDPTTDWVGSSRIGGRYHLDFDGSNDWVNCGTNAALVQLTGEMTVCAWIRPATGGSGNASAVGAFSSGSANAWRLGFNTATNKFNAFWGGGSIGVSTSTLTLDAWSHAGWTRSGSAGSWSLALYKNGIQDNTASTATNPTNSTTATIGATDSAGTPFLGMIDDVRVYSRALSTGDFAQLYSDSLAGYPQTLNRIERRMGYVAAAAFKSAWARNSNVYMGAGAA